MHRFRLVLVALLALVAARCAENGPASSPRVVVQPVLDSLFVNDTLPARTVTYFDGDGNLQPTGPVRWSSSDTAVFRVDSLSGRIAGRGPGYAVLTARANGYGGSALLVVSRAVDVSLLLDTLYLMAGDTLTVPVAVRVRAGPAPTLRFRTAANPSYSLDSVSGRVTAQVPGAKRTFVVVAATATDTAADTGGVEVVQLTDTIGGKAFFSILGTAIERTRAGARAVSYTRTGGQPAFRLSTPVVVQGTTVENVVITVTAAIAAPASFAVDSLSPAEAFGTGADPICRPPRSWGLWTTQAVVPTLRGYSRRGGAIVIQRMVAVPHGFAISGRFSFTGQRNDMYSDPLGALPIRGTFVAPLVTEDPGKRQCP